MDHGANRDFVMRTLQKTPDGVCPG